MNKSNMNFANLLSFSRIFFGIIFLSIYLYTKFYNISIINLIILKSILFILFICSMITDALDGYVARKTNQITDLGKHLDPLTDSIFFIFVFLTFVFMKLMPGYFFIIILLRELFMHVFLRPYYTYKKMSLPANMLGKIKTLFQSIFSGIILFFLIVQQILFMILYTNHKIINLYNMIFNMIAYIFFALITFLSLLSFIIYLINFKKTFQKQ